MKKLLCLVVLVSSLFSLDFQKIEVSSFQVPNGKTALIEFPKEQGIEYERVYIGKKSFQIFDNPTDKSKKYVLLPFSYYEKVGNKKLTIEYVQNKQQKSETMLLKVIHGAYEKEEIEVASSKVNPKSKKVQNRIAQEYNEAMKIYATVTPHSYLHRAFIEPLHSKITSAFGKARVYNGSLKGYHSGTDFRAAMGTPIIAANDGKVVLVKKRFYSGGTVIIDHGEGIYTCYFHMSQFRVKKDQQIKRGEILGLSGQSGRVTGPHLHFSARINSIQVDPLQMIALLNKNLLQGR